MSRSLAVEFAVAATAGNTSGFSSRLSEMGMDKLDAEAEEPNDDADEAEEDEQEEDEQEADDKAVMEGREEERSEEEGGDEEIDKEDIDAACVLLLALCAG
jgi:predicted ATPase with chaperone activity